MLDSENNIRFYSLVDTTPSSLFLKGCSIASEPRSNDGFWYCVSVPTRDSSAYSEMLRIIHETDGRTPKGFRNSTPILIEFDRGDEVALWDSERQAKFANSSINTFLRAYEHTYFDLLVPRHRLDGRPIVRLAHDDQQVLSYTPILLDLDDALLHYLPSHPDIEQDYISLLMRYPEVMTPSWKILIDGVKHFENCNMREAVLCACSAVEFLASSAVERWLERLTLNGGSDGLRNAVRNMGNPLRFEICLSTACGNAFDGIDIQERRKLLEQLCKMNSLRNRVVHVGEEPDPGAAAAALRSAAIFVYKVWLTNLESESVVVQ